MFFPKQHVQPGRRFATGATLDDILLGSFGFISHTVLFLCIGAAIQHCWFESQLFIEITGAIAALCLFTRALQVGGSTTKESFAAIGAALSQWATDRRKKIEETGDGRTGDW